MNFLVRARQETSDLPRSSLERREAHLLRVSPCRAEIHVTRFALRAIARGRVFAHYREVESFSEARIT